MGKIQILPPLYFKGISNNADTVINGNHNRSSQLDNLEL